MCEDCDKYNNNKFCASCGKPIIKKTIEDYRVETKQKIKNFLDNSPYIKIEDRNNGKYSFAEYLFKYPELEKILKHSSDIYIVNIYNLIGNRDTLRFEYVVSTENEYLKEKGLEFLKKCENWIDSSFKYLPSNNKPFIKDKIYIVYDDCLVNYFDELPSRFVINGSTIGEVNRNDLIDVISGLLKIKIKK